MAVTSSAAGSRAKATESTRWTILIFAIVCMVMIANLQYGWTLFVNPINKAHGWDIASIQFAFAVFIALETWLTPVEGWIVDSLSPRNGAKIMVAFGSVMVAIGWIVNSRADLLSMLYLGSIISGIGGGAIYATCVGLAVKWFPDKRGLAVGLTAAGYGAGTALTVIPIRYVIDSYGYEAAFFWFGLIQGGIAFILAWFLRAPEPGEIPATAAPKVAQSRREFLARGSSTHPGVLAALRDVRSGLCQRLDGHGADRADCQRFQRRQYDHLLRRHDTHGGADYRQSRKRRRASAVRLDIRYDRPRVYDGNRFRPGRRGVLAIGISGHRTGAFVIFAALIFLTWGEIFSLFPSTCTDTFGTKFATVNLSLLYTAKGTSAFLVPVANMVKTATGSWHIVFVVTAIMNLIVVALALFVLKPMRRKQMAKT